MNRAKKWAVIHEIDGLQVVMVLNYLANGECNITIFTDLQVSNAGLMTFYVTYSRWLTQEEFDAESTLEKAKAALEDVKREFKKAMEDGVKEPLTIDFKE